MKKILPVCFSLILSVGIASAQKKTKEEKPKQPKQHKELKTETDSVSYALGLAVYNMLQNGGLADINVDLFTKAIKQSMKQEEPWIKKEDIEPMITNYARKVEDKKGQKNLADANKFLEENRKKAGVVALPSGLQYKVISQGTGPKPSANDKVTVHYHGTLINGKVFDSSVDRGEPVQLEVNRVIKGWTEALQLMNVGSKWVLYIPPDLGYGNRSMPGSPIEANSLLIFEVELLSIDMPEEQEKPAFQDMLNK